MRMAFSTLGCPAWDLGQVVRAAQAFGYDAVELRAVRGSLDLLARPEFQSDRIEETRAWLASRCVEVCCVDTSCRFDSPDSAARRKQEEIALRYAELARQLYAPLIRVFPDKIDPASNRAETRTYIAESLTNIARRLPPGVRVALETHGDFAAGAESAAIMALTSDPRIGIVWDAANSAWAGETPAQTAARIAPWLAHVHLRDARPKGGAELWQPVLAGRGVVSFPAVFHALYSIAYGGFVCFEWEKYWHPELEEPEIALADFAAAAGPLMQTRLESWQ